MSARPNTLLAIIIFGSTFLYTLIDLIAGGDHGDKINLPVLVLSLVVVGVTAFLLSVRRVNNH